MRICVLVNDYLEIQGVNSVVDQFFLNSDELGREGVECVGVYDASRFYTSVPLRGGELKGARRKKEKIFQKLKKTFVYNTRFGQSLTVFLRFFKPSKKTAAYYVSQNGGEDVIICQDVLVAYWLIKKGLKNILLMIHSYEYPFSNLEMNYKKIKSTHLSKLLKKRFLYVARNAAGIITICEASARYLKSIAQVKNIYILYNSVSIEADKSKSKKKQRVSFVSASHLTYVKGIDLFAEALKRKGNDWAKRADFYLFGDGPYLSVLRNVIEEYGLNNVHLLGNVSAPYTYYRDKDIYFSTSRLDTLPMGIIEAMASRLPVIATNVGATNEMVCQANGFLVEPNVESVISGIDQVLASTDKLEEMGKRSKEMYEEKFSKKVWVETLSRLLHETEAHIKNGE